MYRKTCGIKKKNKKKKKKKKNADASEGRAIRASQTGVKPHFTAIAEVFRQAVAENAGHKITLYNDFSGRTESAMELTCM